MNARRTSRTTVLALTAVVATALAGCRRQAAPNPSLEAATPEPTPVPVKVMLFFPGDDTLLHREPRELPELPAAVPSRVRLLIAELLAGSRAGWAEPFPWPVSVDAVYQDTAGNVFVDLSAPPADVIEGTSAELAMTYATVNTVVANCPGVERVQLLFGGREVETFGHLDLSRPLAPAPALVAP